MASSHLTKRRFQPVKVDVLGHESGKARFTNDGHYAPPKMLPWRNNLTALSQRYNLYFVAAAEQVHVYVPQFYSQTLGNIPSLILNPPATNPDAVGYIDPDRPMGINHLIVDDLGRNEILVLTTDSGNVAAYHTNTIHRAVRRQAEEDAQQTADDIGIRPFFTHWVYESAWGIAVHKMARLIAISANVPLRSNGSENTGDITVFAFALTSCALDETSSEDHSDINNELSGVRFEDWVEFDEDEELLHELTVRARNFKITLSDHRANIPNIAFANSHCDRAGKLLFSTDIHGDTKIWNVWERRVLRSYDFSEDGGKGRSHELEGERGWSVIPLDPSSFRTADSITEFCGFNAPPDYCPSGINPADPVRPRESYFLRVGLEAPRVMSIYEDLASDPEILDSGLIESSEDEDVDEGGGVSLLVSQADETGGSDATTESPDSEEVVIQMLQDQETRGTSGSLASGRYTSNTIHDLLSDTQSRSSSQNEPGEFDTEIPDDPRQEQSTSDEDSTHSFQSLTYQSWSRPGTEPFVSSDDPRYQTLPSTLEYSSIPVLHLSASNIRLINMPHAPIPHVFFNRPCETYWPPGLAWMYNMDRLNMSAYLPELGVVVAASQTGKVAIITLTKRAETGCLGFRVDWTIPFFDQIRKKQRPDKPLLGLAVGRMQGLFKDTDDSYDDAEKMTSTSKHAASPGLTSQFVDGIARSFDSNYLDFTTLDTATISLDSGSDTDKPKRHSIPYRRTPPQKAVNRRKPPSPSISRRQKSITSSRNSPIFSDVIPIAATTKRSPYRPNNFPQVSAPWLSPHAEAPMALPMSTQIPNTEDLSALRYRLMLTYYDHTVLSYEIGRAGDRLGIWGSGKKNWGSRDDGLIF